MSIIEFDEQNIYLFLNDVCMSIHSNIANILKQSSNSNKHSYILFTTLKFFVGNIQEFGEYWCKELLSIVEYKFGNSYFIFKDESGIYIFIKWILENNLYTFTISFGDNKYINHMISFED
jgi:hypothetical protein